MIIEKTEGFSWPEMMIIATKTHTF